MLDLLVGILHLVVFPGGLFALALACSSKGATAASKPGSSAGWGRR